MTLTPTRLSVVMLAAVLAASAAPAAAQGLNKADASDFQKFRHSIATRHNARVCERNAPDYGPTFDGLYKTWSEKHRDEIVRGETIFREALDSGSPKRYPYVDRATLKKVEEGIEELSKPPRVGEKTPPSTQTAAACQKLLTFLKED